MIRNLPIRTKLFAILIGPLIALTVMASVGIGTSLARKVEAEHLTEEAAAVVNLSKLVDALQLERDLSAGWVAGSATVGEADVVAQREAVDKILASFRKSIESLETHESPFQTRIGLILPELSRLNEGRRQVDASRDVAATLGYYSDLTNRLLAANDETAGDTDDKVLLGRVAAFASIARLKEATSLERGLSNAGAAAGRFDPDQLQTLARVAGLQQAWRTQFNAAASPEQRTSLDQVLGRPAGQGAGAGDTSLVPGAQASGNLDPAQRYRSSTARVERLRTLEQQVAADLSTGAEDAQAKANRQALLYTLILTLVLWLTVGLSFLMARSMVRPLQSLTRTANEVAEERLPGVVEQLQHATDPQDLDVVPEPVPVSSSDEIGQVSTAFNSVHRVAIQVATEQAALRRSIRDMFINLARRSQTLIDRQLELLDDLERSETDPETLEHLFRLDHLSTRMRRNAEDLIVLSDAEPGRHWIEPMTVTDVARAAAAEVEQYQRVEFLPMADVEVVGRVAVDVIHLLAELIENATSFSPPNTKVQVAGQAVPHGYVIEIEDRGLGMTDEELIRANERLASPPEIDFALSRMLGLYVVGRLAQRHGIKVQLRHSWYGGVTALTLLPHELLTWTKVPQMVSPQMVSADAVAVISGLGELPRPDNRSGPTPAPAPSPAPTPSGDHLPIFEAARSDWFVAEPPPRPPRQPQRPSADGGTAERPDGPPRRSAAPPAPEPPPFLPAEPPRVPERPAPAGDDAPLYQTERARRDEPVHLQQPTQQPTVPPPAEPGYRPAPAPAAEPAPATAAGASSPAGPAERITQAGLPRRVPRANLAPGMVATQAAGTQPGPAGGRSPDEVRSMLSSYRTGLERGRTVAGGTEPGQRPPDGP